MTDEIGQEPHELQEQVMEIVQDVKKELSEKQVKQSAERQWINLIGLSTGITSALAAIAAMQAGALSNEAMLAQIRSSDQWAFYQAKSNKRQVQESTVRLLQGLQKPIPPDINNDINRLKQEQQEIQTEARKLQHESQVNLQRHELFARSVASLQVSISLGAVAALLRKKYVWYLGLGLAGIGIAFMVAGSFSFKEKIVVGNAEKSLSSPVR